MSNARVEKFSPGLEAWLAVGGEPEQGGGCYQARVLAAAGATVDLEILDEHFNAAALESNQHFAAIKGIHLNGNVVAGVPDGSDRGVQVKAALRDAEFPLTG